MFPTGVGMNRVDLKHGFILLDRTKNGERREVPINQILRSVFQGLVWHIAAPMFSRITLAEVQGPEAIFFIGLQESGMGKVLGL